MIDDLDEALPQLLIRDLPIKNGTDFVNRIGINVEEGGGRNQTQTIAGSLGHQKH